MNCCICRTGGGETAVSVFDFQLCAECCAKLLRADPAQPEYEWYLAHVRRHLTHPLLQRADNVISIDQYLAGHRAAK